MLTFEIPEDGETIEIHGDSEGLLHLAEILESLAALAVADHAHLMTEDWGGSGLSNSVQGADNSLLNHVKIFVWPQKE